LKICLVAGHDFTSKGEGTVLKIYLLNLAKAYFIAFFHPEPMLRAIRIKIPPQQKSSNLFNALFFLFTNTIMLTLPTLARRVICALDMLLDLRRLQPRSPVLLKRLDPRLKLGLLQSIIVNRANARNTHARVPAAAPIHECSADTTETVFHVVSSRDGGVLAETGEFGFATGVDEVGVFYDEVGGEHAGVKSQ
jgi:hypothetical protein